MATLGFALEWESFPDGVRLDGKTFKAQTPRRFPFRLDVENLEDPLVVQFINARTDEERKAFFVKYGFPKGGGSYPRADALRDQANLKKWLKLAGSESTSEEMIKIFNRHEFQPTMTPSLDGRHLMLQVPRLHDLMIMEIVWAAQSGVRFSACEHCQTVFLTGPLTKRRSHAVFCSPRCRMAATRARQAEE